MRNRRVGTGEKINWADVIRRFPRFDYGTGRQALFLSFSLSLAACAGGGRCNTRIDDPVHYRRSLARSLAQIASRTSGLFKVDRAGPVADCPYVVF